MSKLLDQRIEELAKLRVELVQEIVITSLSLDDLVLVAAELKGSYGGRMPDVLWEELCARRTELTKRLADLKLELKRQESGDLVALQTILSAHIAQAAEA